MQIPRFNHRQRQEHLDQAHELAIASAINSRPDLAGCAGWNIESISLLSRQPDGDRAYQVEVTAWCDDNDSWSLFWEVQTGHVDCQNDDSEIKALYWITK